METLNDVELRSMAPGSSQSNTNDENVAHAVSLPKVSNLMARLRLVMVNLHDFYGPKIRSQMVQISWDRRR